VCDTTLAFVREARQATLVTDRITLAAHFDVIFAPTLHPFSDVSIRREYLFRSF